MSVHLYIFFILTCFTCTFTARHVCIYFFFLLHVLLMLNMCVYLNILLVLYVYVHGLLLEIKHYYYIIIDQLSWGGLLVVSFNVLHRCIVSKHCLFSNHSSSGC